MRHTLEKLLPPLSEQHAPKHLTSASVPSLLTIQQRKSLSQREQFEVAFNAVDTDGSTGFGTRTQTALRARM